MAGWCVLRREFRRGFYRFVVQRLILLPFLAALRLPVKGKTGKTRLAAYPYRLLDVWMGQRSEPQHNGVSKWKTHLYCTSVCHTVISSPNVGVRFAHPNLRGLRGLHRGAYMDFQSSEIFLVAPDSTLACTGCHGDKNELIFVYQFFWNFIKYIKFVP